MVCTVGRSIDWLIDCGLWMSDKCVIARVCVCVCVHRGTCDHCRCCCCFNRCLIENGLLIVYFSQAIAKQIGL